MKFLLAPDSFKGSLKSTEICTILSDAIKAVNPSIKTVSFPISDGGEGFLDSLLSKNNFKVIKHQATLHNKQKIISRYCIDSTTQTAFIEMAETCGLNLIEEPRTPSTYFTYGVGDQILHALNKGIKKFVIGVGGSGTNDCGIGLLIQLGVKFKDSNNNLLEINNLKDILRIDFIDFSNINPLLKECNFTIASDVNSPLTGELGASNIFGPQKGFHTHETSELDNILDYFCSKLEYQLKKEIRSTSGLGSGGGIALPLAIYFDAKIQSGFDVIYQHLNIEKEIINADLVITGEGSLDEQTLSGKVIKNICNITNKHRTPIIALTGINKLNTDSLRTIGLTAAFSITNGPSDLTTAINDTDKNLYKIMQQITNLWIVRRNLN